MTEQLSVQLRQGLSPLSQQPRPTGLLWVPPKGVPREGPCLRWAGVGVKADSPRFWEQLSGTVCPRALCLCLASSWVGSMFRLQVLWQQVWGSSSWVTSELQVSFALLLRSPSGLLFSTFAVPLCIGFLGLPYQSTADWLAYRTDIWWLSSFFLPYFQNFISSEFHMVQNYYMLELVVQIAGSLSS